MPALVAASEDPVVLSELGMFESAARGSGCAVSRTVGLAGLGRIEEAKAAFERARKPSVDDRVRLARVAAPFDAGWALELLPETLRASRAACLVAMGEADAAAASLAAPCDDTESRLIAAAIGTVRRNWPSARASLNAFFEAEDLEAPLDVVDRKITLEDFRATSPQVAGNTSLVSVIVAAKNAEATIETALRSILAQSWPSLEVLVVDDQSEDQTVSVVRRIAETDCRIRLLRNRRAPGAYGARNTGIAEAVGEFVAFHDADDWAHPRRLDVQISAIRGEAIAATCLHFRLDDQGRVMSPRVFPLLRTNPILTVIRRDVLSRLGGFEEVRLGADSELLARLDAAFGRRRVQRVHKPLVVAGWRETSLMGSPVTGFSQQGLARRVAYVEQWRRRHASGRLLPDQPVG